MSRSVLLETANAVLNSYNIWTVEALMAVRSPDCMHYILPDSLSRPSLNNEDYRAYFTPFMPAFRDFHVKAKNTIVDEESRQVVLHASSTAMTDLGAYNNEYIIMLHMTEGGPKIDKFEEFVDSQKSTDFISRLKSHLEGKREKSAL